MSRRPTWLSAAAVGGAIALVSMAAAPVMAQDAAAELPPAGGYTAYPNYGEGVVCEPFDYIAISRDSEGEETGRAPATAPASFNGTPYRGNIVSITATGPNEVVFDLCNPDGAFLPKVAFSAFGIHDADYLLENWESGALRTDPVGTGPYRLQEWRIGEEVIFGANEDYWGEPALTPTVVLRWSSEPGQKLIELQSGTADGIDNPSVDDLGAIEADDNFVNIPREALNVFYLGMNNNFTPFDNQKIRQGVALGIDRQAIVDQFYPPGSVVADYFTPCAIEFGCEGEAWPAFDPEAGRALIAEGLAELGLEEFPEVPISLRIVDRVYLPFPEQVGVELQNQLQENLGIPTFIDVQESGTFIANAYLEPDGGLPGFHLLGWGADYPDTTNFLDFHFGAGAGPQFGQLHPEITEPLRVGATNVDPEIRAEAYVEANNAIRDLVPMVPIATGNSSTAWGSYVEGAHSSPLANEVFAVIATGDDDFVMVQNAEPISFYCADETDGETLRACEQINESLYAFEVGKTTTIPALAESCEPNETFDQWTCTLREGVTFHNGAEFTAEDVVTTYAHIWDRSNPMHQPQSSRYYYMSGLWQGFLDPNNANWAPAE